MTTMKFVYWQEGHMFLGYLEEFPDYVTQGKTLKELQVNLKDIFDEVTSGNIPGVRHVAEMQFA
jgi:predicted RNase H-like HicB family nuclease